jgi:RNA polymerase sporulation-specific sigma factor
VDAGVAKQLFEKKDKLVYDFLHRKFGTLAFDEDIQQIARLGLWKACLAFDADRGMQFSTLAYRCMQNEVLQHFRREKKNVVPSCSIYDPFGDPEDGIQLIEALTSVDRADDCIPTMAYEKALASISDRDKRIVKLCIKGFSQKKVAQEVGISQSVVSRIIKHFQQKFMQYMR